MSLARRIRQCSAVSRGGASLEGEGSSVIELMGQHEWRCKVIASDGHSERRSTHGFPRVSTVVGRVYSGVEVAVMARRDVVTLRVRC